LCGKIRRRGGQLRSPGINPPSMDSSGNDTGDILHGAGRYARRTDSVTHRAGMYRQHLARGAGLSGRGTRYRQGGSPDRDETACGFFFHLIKADNRIELR